MNSATGICHSGWSQGGASRNDSNGVASPRSAPPVGGDNDYLRALRLVGSYRLHVQATVGRAVRASPQARCGGQASAVSRPRARVGIAGQKRTHRSVGRAAEAAHTQATLCPPDQSSGSDRNLRCNSRQGEDDVVVPLRDRTSGSGAGGRA